MVSIHTNLSSLIAQGSLTKSTNTLNRAIEQMSTGYKINHASDNAANYSIKTNMDTKIGAYQVAEDNAMMGLDMLQTAESSLNQISDKLSRLRALAVTAQNGTYGDQSKAAINAEANALVDEIERIYSNTNYNGIDLMRGKVLSTEESKFIKDIDRRDTSKMTTLASVDETIALTSGTYSISTAEELAKLATMTNNGLIGGNTEFVLGADIDLSGYGSGEGWVPIGGDAGWSSNAFKGCFDGNGYVISNLTIDRENASMQGLFGYVVSAVIKNLGLKNVSIKAKNYAGSLAGVLYESTSVKNVYVEEGDVVGSHETMCYIGGLVGGLNRGQIEAGYIRSIVSGVSVVGGIVGSASYSTINECFVDISLNGKNRVGGLLGSSFNTTISACYSTGVINATDYWAGGLVGIFDHSMIKNSYSNSELMSVGAGIVGVVYDNDSLSKLINCKVLNNAVGSSGIFCGELPTYSNSILTLENCSYDSSIDPSVPLLGNISAVSPSRLIEFGTKSKKIESPFLISTDANISSYNDSLNFQIGSSASVGSNINICFDYLLEDFDNLREISLNTLSNIVQIDELLLLTSKQLLKNGCLYNRLMSVLEEINVQYENLVSSRSTIQDADMGEVSATYIQQQILQQASATLMATANQTPAIALQLL